MMECRSQIISQKMGPLEIGRTENGLLALQNAGGRWNFLVILNPLKHQSITRLDPHHCHSPIQLIHCQSSPDHVRGNMPTG